MKKIFILYEYDYDQDHILGVYNDKEAAERALRRKENKIIRIEPGYRPFSNLYYPKTSNRCTSRYEDCCENHAYNLFPEYLDYQYKDGGPYLNIREEFLKGGT